MLKIYKGLFIAVLLFMAACSSPSPTAASIEGAWIGTTSNGAISAETQIQIRDDEATRFLKDENNAWAFADTFDVTLTGNKLVLVSILTDPTLTYTGVVSGKNYTGEVLSSSPDLGTIIVANFDLEKTYRFD